MHACRVTGKYRPHGSFLPERCAGIEFVLLVGYTLFDKLDFNEKKEMLKVLKNFKGAIFDMDGTLIDSLMLWNVLWDKFGETFLKNESFRPSGEDDKAVRTMTLKDAMDYLHSVYGIGSCGEELLQTANAIIVDFYANEVELKKGVAEFLEYCYANGVKMCVASATDMSLLKVAIEHCRIEKYFSDVFSCAEIGKGKDEPDIYLKALDCLGTRVEETYIFEDSHIAIKTASGIGVNTVGIYDKFNYGQEEMKRIADVYIGEGETLLKLLG